MAGFLISGGVPLQGRIEVSGAKNAALPMMAAAILADGPVTLQNVPCLIDVAVLARLLGQLGVRVIHESHGLTLDTVDPRPIRAEYELVRQMRASFCVLGPLLARRGRAEVALPGGCGIGHRPVDLHLKGLAALGARIRLRGGLIEAHAERLRGATIDLAGPRGPSVTGTANVMMAATLAEGATVILGAAREPEIVDLGTFLNGLGARIGGLGSSRIEIEGVERLSGGTHRVIPDRIEAGTLLLAVAMTGGEATLVNLCPAHLVLELDRLRAVGAEVRVEESEAHISAAGPLHPLDLTAEPYPGLPTDLQAQWMACLALANGRSTIRDRVFPERFSHLDELRRLGARLRRRGSLAVIRGVPQFSGAEVTASDLRASAALVLAGLVARGQTLVRDVAHLDRGYERFDEKLQLLGARVVRVEPRGELTWRGLRVV